MSNLNNTEITPPPPPANQLKFDENNFEIITKNGSKIGFLNVNEDNEKIAMFSKRMVVKVIIDDKISVPFYASTGKGGKKNVEKDKWYPFWGIGELGWLNKTNEKDINNFYGIPKLKEIADILNKNLPVNLQNYNKDQEENCKKLLNGNSEIHAVNEKLVNKGFKPAMSHNDRDGLRVLDKVIDYYRNEINNKDNKILYNKDFTMSKDKKRPDTNVSIRLVDKDIKDNINLQIKCGKETKEIRLDKNILNEPVKMKYFIDKTYDTLKKHDVATLKEVEGVLKYNYQGLKTSSAEYMKKDNITVLKALSVQHVTNLDEAFKNVYMSGRPVKDGNNNEFRKYEAVRDGEKHIYLGRIKSNGRHEIFKMDKDFNSASAAVFLKCYDESRQKNKTISNAKRI